MKNSSTINSLVVMIIMVIASVAAFGQNFTSTANGNWSTAGNWGGSAPPTSGQSWGTINVNHNMTITGNYSTSAGALNIAANKQLTVSGNFSQSSGITTTVSGTLYVTGNATFDAAIQVQPGGKVYILGNAVVRNSNYLRVGTSVAPPEYADLAIYGNYESQSSGDITVNRNGRVAIFGSAISSSSGGSLFTINNGGQVYIDDNISYTGGGDRIINNNTTDPYGLYVNGTTSNTGGGAQTTGNMGNKNTMQTTNVPFYNWVQGLPNSPLPVELLFFKSEVNNGSVELKWSTAIEINFDRFIVERSIDGINFHEVASVKGAGNSKERHDYSIQDLSPIVGRSYYKLKALDFDGSYEYFNVVSVDFKGGLLVSLFPNPSEGNGIHISTNFKPSVTDRVQIFDNTGLLISEYPLNDFSNQINFTKALQSGAYLLRYVSDDYNQVIRFTVK
jgi:hypothetical protein